MWSLSLKDWGILQNFKTRFITLRTEPTDQAYTYILIMIFAKTEVSITLVS